jgi:hypothetical protein
MARYVNVRLTNASEEVSIKADTVDTREDRTLIVMRGTAIVGTFYPPHVQGWWIVEEDD